MEPSIIDGDLLDQDAEVIVNAWNRNVIPWWLLLPQGVAGAIKVHLDTATRSLVRAAFAAAAHGAKPPAGK